LNALIILRSLWRVDAAELIFPIHRFRQLTYLDAGTESGAFLVTASSGYRVSAAGITQKGHHLLE
jgi:hypothetical protein